MHFDHIYLLTYLFPDPSPIPYPPTPLFVCFFKSVRTNLYCPNSLGCLESGHWRVDFFTGGYAVKENRVSLFFSQQWTNSCTDDPEWFITKSVLGAGSSLPFPQQPLLPLFWSTFWVFSGCVSPKDEGSPPPFLITFSLGHRRPGLGTRMWPRNQMRRFLFSW